MVRAGHGISFLFQLDTPDNDRVRVLSDGDKKEWFGGDDVTMGRRRWDGGGGGQQSKHVGATRKVKFMSVLIMTLKYGNEADNDVKIWIWL